jgi:hypothetical protein
MSTTNAGTGARITSPWYHGGIRDGVFGGMTKRPKPVTCTNVERLWCGR